MTYKELYESAADKLEKSKITLGEFEKMIEPLNAEVATADSDTISRAKAIEALVGVTMFKTKHEIMQRVNASVQDEQGWLGAVAECLDEIEDLPSAQPETHEERTETHACDLISRQAALNALSRGSGCGASCHRAIKALPSAQLGQRYTNEELMIFQHGISLSLLSKRSAQHWRYDENTATEIKFLERLYEKVSANMRGGQNE